MSESESKAGLPSVTDATFEQEVLRSDKPVLVDFWAPWCAPCRQVSPILEEIAKEHSEKITFVKVNTDDNDKVATRYGITGLPTMALYSNGEIIKTIVGAKPKTALLRELSPWLS